jgi:CheY-like chemotaxis protein
LATEATLDDNRAHQALARPTAGGPDPDYARSVQPSELPVVFVTAYHTELSAAMRDAGGNLSVSKPLEFRELIRAITSMHLSGIGGSEPRK